MNPKDSRNNNGKRGGTKFVDKRNWKSCNKELVIRGEFSLPIDMFDNWYEELDKMNEGKKCGRMNFLNRPLKSRLYGISGLITCFLRW
jgi:hypothetical protein